jgi:hypothetical protein
MVYGDIGDHGRYAHESKRRDSWALKLGCLPMSKTILRERFVQTSSLTEMLPARWPALCSQQKFSNHLMMGVLPTPIRQTMNWLSDASQESTLLLQKNLELTIRRDFLSISCGQGRIEWST